MAIRFREDNDLKFLQFCDNDDLSILVEILKGKDGDERITEKLTSNERFKACNGDYTLVWDLIAAEIQLYGADSIVSAVRGHGVTYREILTDVCKRTKVKFQKDDEVVGIEMLFLLKLVEDSLEKMTPEEREAFAKDFNLDISSFTPQVILIALQAAIRMSGFAAYQIAVVVANSVAKAILGRGLNLAANAALVRWLGLFAGPVGWALAAVITVPLISGPAYRVTIPAVVQVAYMRQKSLNIDHF